MPQISYNLDNGKTVLLQDKDGAPMAPITLASNVIGMSEYIKYDDAGPTDTFVKIDGDTSTWHDGDLMVWDATNQKLSPLQYETVLMDVTYTDNSSDTWEILAIKRNGNE